MKIKTEAQELAQIRLAMRGAEKQTGIFAPQELIKLALERHGDKAVISWSGGRCSTVVLFMALKINPNIRAFFNDMGGAEYPETIKFVKETARKHNINLTIVTPERTIFEIFKKYGYPKPRRPADTKKGIPAIRTPKCCHYIKEKPLIKAMREAGDIDAVLTGLRAAEARIRALSTHQKGQFYFHKKSRFWRYNPVVFWPTTQLIEFIKTHNIDNPVYDKYGLDRTGCWPCTAFVGWQKVMARTRPKFYAWLTKQMGPQRILEHFHRTKIDPPCKTEVRGS